MERFNDSDDEHFNNENVVEVGDNGEDVLRHVDDIDLDHVRPVDV